MRQTNQTASNHPGIQRMCVLPADQMSRVPIMFNVSFSDLLVLVVNVVYMERAGRVRSHRMIVSLRGYVYGLCFCWEFGAFYLNLKSRSVICWNWSLMWPTWEGRNALD